MRVLQINAVYGYGSTGATTEMLSDYIKKCGHESFVAYQQTNKPVQNGYRIGNMLDWKFHALYTRVLGKQGFASKRTTKRLLHWISSIKPDVVHLRNLHSNYVNLPMLITYLSKNNIATVVTLHDCWFFTGKCTHYTMEHCIKWQVGCGDCPKLKKEIKSLFFDRTNFVLEKKRELFENIEKLGVIGVSDWITTEAKKSILKNATLIKRIYNWIDLETFYPKRVDLYKKYNIDIDKSLILCVSAGWGKDTVKYNYLLELSKKINENTIVVLAGSLKNPNELPNNIKYVGYIRSTSELADLYSGVDCYVHLSAEDTFGKVIAESMACGTPAIVYNSTACPELIKDGCGYVVPCGDVDKIVDCIGEIRHNGKSFYSQHCIDYVRNNFEKNKLIQETLDFYKDLLEE